MKTLVRSASLAAALPLTVPALEGAGKELTGVYTPAAGPCPTVEEAIRKMTVPPGYEVRNFAAEPMIINPVAMTWDNRGRLWVVELFEYPKGAAKPNKYSESAADETWRSVLEGGGPEWPRDRVVILEDSDNDGTADKRTVFVDGLNLATGIALGHGGAFVGQAPNLFFFRDTNGDDKADEFKTVLTGFGLEDRHELLNGFCWGPDGQLYFTHGVFTHSKVRRPGEPKESGFTINAGVFRMKFGAGPGSVPGKFDPVAVRYEVFADGTSNPWGVDFDADGNAFVSACVIDHLFHMAPGGLYQRQGGSPEYPYAYELLPSIVEHKHFRAAYAGLQVYQGGVYPADTHGHIFIGNIHDNAVHEEKVESVGATFKASPVRDFLRANDGWFRPVSTQTGPDGNLWIMDWCDKYPCYQNAQANPEGVDRERGRIWRVVHRGDGANPAAGGSRPERDMDFAKMPVDQLIEKLGDRNSWVRRQARRQLIERMDRSIAGALRPIATQKDNPRRLDALWVLIGASQTNDRVLSAIRQDKDPAMRLWAARGAGEAIADLRVRLGDRRVADLPEQEQTEFRDLNRIGTPAGLTADPEPSVRLAAAVALRQAAGGWLTRNDSEPLLTCWPAIPSLIERGSVAGDKTLPFVIWTSIEPLVGQGSTACLTRLHEVAPKSKPLSLTLTYKTMRRLCDTRKSEMVDLAMDFVSKIAADGELLASALDGLVKGQEAGAVKPAREMTAAFEAWTKHERADVRERATQLATLWGDPGAVQRLLDVALDADGRPEARLGAVKTLRKLRSELAREGIRKLVANENDPALLTESMRAAAELGGDEFPALLVSHWASKSPVLRTTAVEVLLSREAWAARWLDAVEEGGTSVDPASIPNTARRYFATAAPAALKTRAEKVLGKWNETPADVKQLIARKRRVCLDGEPDFELGRTIFMSACATCHKFHGGGVEVGPDLIGSGRSNLDALLSNVLDPNQIIGRGYENFVVTTKDGRTLSGRLIEDTPTRVRLLGITAREEVVARDQISKIENSGSSVMPMGFAELPDDQFRSLVWFVLAPPEEGPLTKDKREALSRGVDGEGATQGRDADDARRANREEAGASIDWESVSLWNPDWKVGAPEFEGTPRRHAEYHGRQNVIEVHPFPETRKSPATLEHSAKLPADRAVRLVFEAASHDRGDWQLIVSVDGRELKRALIGHDGERWRKFEVDLAEWKGQAPKIRIEAWANNWSWEFAYFAGLRIE